MMFNLKADDSRLPVARVADNSIPYREAAVSDGLTDDRSLPDPKPTEVLTPTEWEHEMRNLVDLINEGVMAETLRIEQLPGGRLRVLFPRVRTVWED